MSAELALVPNEADPRRRPASFDAGIFEAHALFGRAAFVMAGLEGLLDYAEPLGDTELSRAISRAATLAGGVVMKRRDVLRAVSPGRV